MITQNEEDNMEDSFQWSSGYMVSLTSTIMVSVELHWNRTHIHNDLESMGHKYSVILEY